jgi:hypothetical protein
LPGQDEDSRTDNPAYSQGGQSDRRQGSAQGACPSASFSNAAVDLQAQIFAIED